MLDVAPPSQPELSDEVLVAHAKNGARSAFAALVSRYQDRIFRLSLRMSRNESDAEEITQETFLLALRGISSFQGDSSFRTWLYRIGINQALMFRRSARRRPVEPLAAEWEGDMAAAGDAVEGADILVERKMLVKLVRTALATLDPSDRAALVLRDIEELTAEESARILGISPCAVRQRAHRARLKLRKLVLESSVPMPPVERTHEPKVPDVLC